MNIWQWIETLQKELADAGQRHNAELIDRVSGHVCDLETERAEALLPEARALARTIRNPWLEVFVRHWEMRNRLGSKREGDTALPEAVALFEFAHRAETQHCPQSICVTQDLSACYANTDGPGWVEERIAVCDETLARITPKWACFQCISGERAEAMIDAGQAADADAYLQAQRKAVEDAGETVGPGLIEMHWHALLAQGRHADALAQIEAEEAKVQGPEWGNVKQPREILKAQALAALGRDDDALEALPALRDVNPGHIGKWLAAIHPVLLRNPALNHWDLGRRLQEGLDHHAAHGAHRHLIEMAALCIELAIARNAAWTAQRQLALAMAHLPRLRRDAGAAATLNALKARIDAMPQTPLPVPAEQLLSWLDAQSGEDNPRNPEQEAQWLLAAVQALPDDGSLREQAVEALQACGAQQTAIDLLWQYLQTRTTQDEPLAYTLANLLLQGGRPDEVERLAALFDAHAPIVALRCRAQLAHARQDWPALQAQGEELVRRFPDQRGAHATLAHSLMQQQKHAEAAARYLHMADTFEEDRSAQWDYLTAATAAGDWAGVRAMAVRMGMTVPDGEGPIDDDYGWVIVRCTDDGESTDYYARRTGPVSAEIIENALVPRRQHVGDRVAFDAQPLTEAPEDEEARQRHIPTFAAVHTLQRGGFSPGWLVDGATPGDAAYEVLRDAFVARGWRVWAHSSDDYTVTDTAHGDATLPGLYFSVAAPETVPALDIHNALSEATRDWPHRMAWYRLAEHCGVDTETHREIIERYRL